MSLEKASSSERTSWMREGEKLPPGHGRTTTLYSLDLCSTSTRIRGISNRYIIQRVVLVSIKFGETALSWYWWNLSLAIRMLGIIYMHTCKLAIFTQFAKWPN